MQRSQRYRYASPRPMGTISLFKDRVDAGERLAKAVLQHGVGPDAVVLGLPRGGIPVAERVAELCKAPLDIFVVRKIGTPGHEELAAGAIASGGTVVWNERVLRSLRLTESDLQQTVALETREVERREHALRSPVTPPVDIRGKTVVLVDDGVATGATMRAAIRAVKRAAPERIIVALPVCPDETCLELEKQEGCAVICLKQVSAEAFGSVGSWYEDFTQVETEQCRTILEDSRKAQRVITTAPAASRAQNLHQPSEERRVR